MTEAQLKKFYMPQWAKCARANGWRMVNQRLACEPTESQSRSPWHAEVWAEADKLARQEHRAVTADDLRHACNLVASLGRAESSWKLTSHQCQRVVNLFKLLRDPEDLNAIIAWENADLARHRAILATLERKGIDSTLKAISSNAYGHDRWRTLNLQQLCWVYKQIARRDAA